MSGAWKSVVTVTLVAALVGAFEAAIYDWGYNRGFRRGSIAMRDAIMCVLERTASIQPYKYCAEQARESAK